MLTLKGVIALGERIIYVNAEAFADKYPRHEGRNLPGFFSFFEAPVCA